MLSVFVGSGVKFSRSDCARAKRTVSLVVRRPFSFRPASIWLSIETGRSKVSGVAAGEERAMEFFGGRLLSPVQHGPAKTFFRAGNPGFRVGMTVWRVWRVYVGYCRRSLSGLVHGARQVNSPAAASD